MVYTREYLYKGYTMRKHSIARQKRDAKEICAKLAHSVVEKEISKIPFILYHLVKQCPNGQLCVEIRKRDYSNVYKHIQRKGYKLGKKQVEKCIKKLDELIL